MRSYFSASICIHDKILILIIWSDTKKSIYMQTYLFLQDISVLIKVIPTWEGKKEYAV